MDLIEIDEVALQLSQIKVISIGKTDIGRVLEGEYLATEEGDVIMTENTHPITL